ncbi:HdeD family acid-resistance protein (plasmid) [Bradyrhizobium barranii subsp. apii]|uniref:HdeD family acid-resistance protein n=1 Tax=Bradyrhizobium barranii subsp. apii TaxID=2819348 RepID=A0A8T5VIH3_9BRAD|nr:HdeD family acid-resistance protein [Bradyrhizobium barranii]UPT92319.1 HdeD family acid-resistance protein [Bradyrhizobium barranii subsp. apii]
MPNSSDVLRHFRPGPDIAPIPKWGWMFALGVVYLITGFVALGSVALATVASVLLVGVMMVIAGVAEVISAFQVKTWGKFLLCALLGALYIVAGFVTFENTALAAALLTLMLGALLVAAGIMRLLLAFSMKRATPRFWLAIAGVITLLVGLLILARWPLNSVYILGLFLSLDLIMSGTSWIGISVGLRRSSIMSQARSPA